MRRIIAIANQKGGVGKITTCTIAKPNEPLAEHHLIKMMLLLAFDAFLKYMIP